MTETATVSLIKATAASVDRFIPSLTPDEYKRYQTLTGHSAAVFAVTRGLLRHKLGRILDCAAGEVPLHQDSSGPLILDCDQAVSFSVSHSGAFGAVIIAENTLKLGLDIEDMSRPRPNIQKIIQRYFNESEQHWVTAQADPLTAFYQLWTLKESITKMDHAALAHYLQGTEIDMTGESPHLIGETPKGSSAVTLQNWQKKPIMLSVACNKTLSILDYRDDGLQQTGE